MSEDLELPLSQYVDGAKVFCFRRSIAGITWLGQAKHPPGRLGSHPNISIT